MEVSVETTENLKRRLTVSLPLENIDSEVSKRLKSMVRTTRLNGFRPGKVPLRVIQKKFGTQVRSEVIGEQMHDSFNNAVEKEKLKIVSRPDFKMSENSSNEVLSYTAEFEVYPEITVNIDDIKVEKDLAEVTDSDIDSMLETLRKQRTTWNNVEREIQTNDRVEINLTEKVADNEDSRTEDMFIEIGSKRFLEGFDEGLIGAKVGDTVELDLDYPEKFHSEALASKDTHFSVIIKGVAEANVPEIDDEFIKSFGNDKGLEDFRKEIHGNMSRELEQALKRQLKENLLNALLEKNEVDVPEVLIQSEAQHMLDEMHKDLEKQGIDQEKLDLSSEMFKVAATKRVRLSVILGEISNANKIEAQQEQIDIAMQQISSTYENPAEVIDWIKSDEKYMSNITASVREEAIVNWVLANVEVVEKESSLSSIMEKQQRMMNKAI
jgi:trigger factor